MSEKLEYRSVDEYRKAIDALFGVCGIALFSFAKFECKKKDIIIRNYVARGAKSLRAIMALWDIDDYQNAWVIHRSIVDRLFHLRFLGESDSFLEYDDWSFFEQFKAQNKVKSDIEFKHEAVGWLYELTEEQRKRASFLEQNKPMWKRPKPEIVAKKMEMSFLYHYGYDYASTHVHPMSNDGEYDFYNITNLECPSQFPSHIVVLSNSILAVSMLLQDAMNYSSFVWRRMMWDFLEDIRKMLRTDNLEYCNSFLKIAGYFQANKNLCEPSSTK